MLQASDFTPVGFEATFVGFGLTKSLGRLVARLLSDYADELDDRFEHTVPRRTTSWSQFQFVFRDRGLLDITPAWIRFGGEVESIPDPSMSIGVGVPSIGWAVELLTSIMRFQKQSPVTINLAMTWLLEGSPTPAALVEHLGLSSALNGLFAASDDFEIRGDTRTEMPHLFSVECELTAGRTDYGIDEPGAVGVKLVYRSPDNRLGEAEPVSYTPEVVDRFFTAAPVYMQRQLATLFPSQRQP